MIARNIRAARLDEIEVLRDIERASGEQFREIGMTKIADDEPMPVAEMLRHISNSQAWVYDLDRPVAFLMAESVDGNLHVEQLSTHPEASRHGYGRALIEHAVDVARRDDIPAITLCTFRDVPWNAPYYERCGFRALADGELSPGLQRLRQVEVDLGIAVWPRVCMRRDL